MADNDDRTYIKLHDGMPDHPKVDGLSDKAFRLLVETWCWCSRHLTDGYVPQSTWLKRGTKTARKELMDAGLVRSNATGGIECHDYLSHQRSAQQVAELREKKKLASAKGNHGKWHVGPQGKPSPTCPWCPRDEDVPAEDPPPDQREEAGQAEMFSPNGIAGAIANASHVVSQEVSGETRETSPETEGLLRNPQTETDSLAPRGGSGGSSSEPPAGDKSKTPSRKRSGEKRSAAQNGHVIPPDWWPTESDQQWFRDKCHHLTGVGIANELTEEFKRYWEARPGKDGRKLDWSKTWMNRMSEKNRQARERGETRTQWGKAQTGDVIASGARLVAEMEAAEAAGEQSQGVLAPVYEITRGA